MAKVYFTLTKLINNKCHIRLRYKFKPNTEFVYYTGEYINEKYWNSKTSTVRTSFYEASKINDYLDHLAHCCRSIRREMLLKGENYTTNEFKLQLNAKLGKIKDKKILWKDVYLKYVTNRHLKSRLSKLENLYPNIEVKNISPKVYYGIAKDEFEKENCPAYVNKIISTILGVLRQLKKSGFEVHKNFDEYVPYKAIPRDQTFLSTPELEKIYYYSDYTPSIRNAVNLYMIGAFTGQRLGDFKKIAKSPSKYIQIIQGKEFVKIHTNKSKGRQVALVPLHPIVKEVLKKNIRIISDQKLRDYIKIACRTVGINQSFTRTEWFGLQPKEVTYERWQIISTHTARRSLITNLYIEGVDIRTIMIISTHTTEAQLRQYIKTTIEVNANLLKDHPYFLNKNHLNIAN